MVVTVVSMAGGCGGDRAAARGDGGDMTIDVPADTLIDTVSGLIGGVADLHVHPNGRLYVSDPQANAIHVFEESGRYAHTFGREGAGPGEFRRLGDLQTMGDTLVVVDAGSGRLQLLSPEGDQLAARTAPPTSYWLTVGPNGLLVRSTLGIDSVLAIAYGMDGGERMRLGDVLAPPSRMIDLSQMKREIANGDVPAVFLNDARSTIGEAGYVWLYVPAAGQVERYDSTGARVVSVQLSEPEFEAVRARFVSRNADTEPNAVFPLRYFLRARAVGSELWVLIDSGPDGAATILTLSQEGEITNRLRFTQVRGAGDFAVDERASTIYFFVPDTAELLRVSIEPAA